METPLLDSHTCNAIWNRTNELLEIQQQITIFNGLKGELKRDGNQWCASAGEWPEHNISGFGDSPAMAMNQFMVEYYKSIK